LAKLPQRSDPNLLVGFDTNDDAGVYRLNDEMALVTTADFITPPVDDPYLFGQIGAANALSDIYAMGGKPLTCLNLVGFPSQKLPPEILLGIVEGALSKITEAEAVLAGGHTTDDEEPKFGLAVTGIIHPDNVWRNIGAQPGDVLILTKPIGSGVLFNANRKNWVSESAMAACLQTITTLNKTAASVISRFPVHAATDITGFGLAGHGLEMAQGSGVTLSIQTSAVPLMQEALAMYEKGMRTGVNRANRELIGNAARFVCSLPDWHEEIFVDPQTSGGLLVAVPEANGQALLTALHDSGVSHAAVIGEVLPCKETNYLLFK
jgi:selenide, water dikinase